MTDRAHSADMIITEESVTLSSEECRRLRRSSDILSHATLRKKLRWLEYAKSGQSPPCITVSDCRKFVIADIDPVHTARQTLEIPHTSDFSVDGEQHEGVLYRVWFCVRNPERVEQVYAANRPQQDAVRRYLVRTVDLDTGTTEKRVVRTSGDSVTTTGADFQIYPPDEGIFNE